MQIHLDGYEPGDPEVARARPGRTWTPDLSDEVDVLIVGSGPAGLVLAAQLARFPEITTRIVERREGPLSRGQADGVACRTVEMFDAFGLSDRLLREAYWITETTFWAPDPSGSGAIVRTGRIQDVEDGLSEFPHVILNQARVQDLLLDSMSRSASRLQPNHGLELTGLRTGADSVVATLRSTTDPTEEHTVTARYVVGCDGARSRVREAIGRRLEGDSANHAWGVMDLLAVTDFPDIRRKALVQSDAGTLMVIPREGGYLFRIYVEMDRLAPGERVRSKQLDADDLIQRARHILAPHTLDVREVAWWSVYEVGQRLTDQFDDAEPGDPTRGPRVFLAGDACHTHSPKAGQGMNVSMQDAFNLGWKLAAVLQGRSEPALLHSYSDERQGVAQELIDFDRHWAASLTVRPRDARGGDLQQEFAQQGRYTAGVATRYPPGLLTGPGDWQHLATGFPIGARFHSAPVTRLADSRPMQLGHVAEADGRWRLYAFGDRLDVRDPTSRLRAWCEALTTSTTSPMRRFTPAGADPDSVLDVRAVLQQPHTSLDPDALPALLLPAKGRLGLVDYEKVFAPAPEDVFTSRGIDRDLGALVVVRPDQYVAHVLPLDAPDLLAHFLAGFMRDATGVDQRAPAQRLVRSGSTR